MKLTYTAKFGKLKGLPHVPYKARNGLFVVSKDRFSRNYIYVKTIEEAYQHLKAGLKIRMQYDNKPASLIQLSSLQVEI